MLDFFNWLTVITDVWSQSKHICTGTNAQSAVTVEGVLGYASMEPSACAILFSYKCTRAQHVPFACATTFCY